MLRKRANGRYQDPSEAGKEKKHEYGCKWYRDFPEDNNIIILITI